MIFVAEKNFSFEEYAKERKKQVTLFAFFSESNGFKEFKEFKESAEKKAHQDKKLEIAINPSFLACCGDFFGALANSFDESSLGDNSKQQIDSKYLTLISLLDITPSFVVHPNEKEEFVQIRVECNQKKITLENAMDMLIVSHATGLTSIQNACANILLADIQSHQIIPPFEIYTAAKEIRLESLSDGILEQFRLHPRKQFFSQTNPTLALKFFNDYVEHVTRNEEKLIQQGTQGGIKIDGEMYYLAQDKAGDWFIAQIKDYKKEQLAPFLVTFIGFASFCDEWISKGRLFPSNHVQDWLDRLSLKNRHRKEISGLMEKLLYML